MTFAEKLKNARKQAGISQEILAEKLCVSRQAVTKWETEMGLPDIANMMAISKLFNISVDEFLAKEKEASIRKGYLYESNTEYDIDGSKHFDIKLGGTNELKVYGVESEKVVVRLGSNTLENITQCFKTKIDDIKGRIDIDVNRQNKMTEATAKEDLFIEIFLPKKYLSKVEIEANARTIFMNNLDCPHIEFQGKTSFFYINDVNGRLEIDSGSDVNFCVSEFSGSLEINQIYATSRLSVPADFKFRSVVKGIKTSVAFEDDGTAVEDFSDKDADTVIEFNGMKSELVIFHAK